MTIRTRFAPSPTGYLHVGGARTALFSWLYARKHGGRFVLRIEDTDLERSTAESVKAILDGMSWLGLDYDEGPFYQTQRFDRYKEIIQEIQKIQKGDNLVPGRFYFFLAQAQGGLKDRKKANAALNQFLKLYPHHAKVQNAKFNIGRNLWNLGQPMAGAKYFLKVTQEAPSSELAVKAQFFLGKIYEERKNFPEALKNYKIALEKYPQEY